MAATTALENRYLEDVEPMGAAEKADFISALYKHFTVQKACEKTGYELRRVMHAKDDDAEFDNALSIAEKHLSVIGEDELKRRAIHGVESTIVANGRVVYEVKDGVRRPMIERKYSDALLKTYLEANNRSKFGAKVEITNVHRGHIALPVLSPALMNLLLADARGEHIELIADHSMGATDDPQIVQEAEFEVIGPERADMDEIRRRVRALTDPSESDEFDIL